MFVVIFIMLGCFVYLVNFNVLNFVDIVLLVLNENGC